MGTPHHHIAGYCPNRKPRQGPARGQPRTISSTTARALDSSSAMAASISSFVRVSFTSAYMASGRSMMVCGRGGGTQPAHTSAPPPMLDQGVGQGKRAPSPPKQKQRKHHRTSSAGLFPTGDEGGSTRPGGSSNGSNKTCVCLMLAWGEGGGERGGRRRGTWPEREKATLTRVSRHTPASGRTAASTAPNVLEGPELVVHEARVDLGDDVQPLHNLSKHSVLAVQVIDVVPGRHIKLRVGHDGNTGKGDGR
jgi:hypothetical protein